MLPKHHIFSRQELFDYVATHLLTQKGKAKSNGVCVYLDPKSGRKCAAGCLIPDDLYDPAWDVGGVNVMVLWSAGALPNVSYHDLGLLRKLQIIHDLDPVVVWREELLHCATVRGLLFNEEEYRLSDLEDDHPDDFEDIG